MTPEQQKIADRVLGPKPRRSKAGAIGRIIFILSLFAAGFGLSYRHIPRGAITMIVAFGWIVAVVLISRRDFGRLKDEVKKK
jgi:hypothetical protein